MSEELEQPDAETPVAWRSWAWILFLLPALYLLIFTLPKPFGLGLQYANDFYGNRIWWAQLSSYQLYHGYVPIWNHTENFGGYHLGFKGPGFLYLPVLWVYLVGFIGGPLNYVAQYLNLAMHMGFGLLGIFAINLRFGKVHPAAAAMGASVFLLNNRFNDSVQYANTIETVVWVPWMLFFALLLVRQPQSSWHWRNKTVWQYTLGLAVCTGMSWLAGYGHLTAIGILLVGLVSVLAVRNVGSLALVALGGTVGCILALPMVYVSAMKAVGTPERSGGSIEWADAYPLHYSLRTILSKPFSMDISSSPFFLPVFLLLLAAGLVFAWKKPRGQLSAALLVAMLVIADLSRGRAGLLFPIFYEHVPFYGSFRIQGRNTWLAFIPLAWFSAIGVDGLLPYRKRLWWGLPILILFCGVLGYGFYDQPFDGSSYAPFTQKWITYDFAPFAYGFLTLGAGLSVMLFLGVDSHPARTLSLALLTFIFVFFYGSHAAFTGKGMTKWAKIPAPGSYAQGSLQSFQARDAGPERMLWPTGTISKEDQGNVAYLRAVGEAGTPFPASRFVVLDGHENLDVQLKLTSMGAQHLTFTVNMPEHGKLVYFNSFANAWKCNVEIDRGPGLLNGFMAFELPAGESTIELRFRNLLLLGLCAVTILGLGCCLAASLRLAGRKKLSLLMAVLTVVYLGLFMYGATHTRSYPESALYGNHREALDEDGRVPVRPVTHFADPTLL